MVAGMVPSAGWSHVSTPRRKSCFVGTGDRDWGLSGAALQLRTQNSTPTSASPTPSRNAVH